MVWRDIASVVDLSAVRADTTHDEVRALAVAAKAYGCICATTLPTFTPLLLDLLADDPEIMISGNVGFPSGATTKAVKAREAEELRRMGCQELDMVINVGQLKSGNSGYVLDDIKGVIDAGDGVPVKVILECYYLNDDEVRSAVELCIRAGAAFVKTGTGWAPTGATVANIALIKSIVGDRIAIKASGGIRSLETLERMYHHGARRFGIGLTSALPIFQQATLREGLARGEATANRA